MRHCAPRVRRGPLTLVRVSYLIVAWPLVLGIDSSTQSTKAVLVDAADGTVVEARTAPHPAGTEVDPRAWLAAFDAATDGLLPRADAVAVGGQQHGMVALDAAGEPVRDALLWNDTRSAAGGRALVAEMGGPQACADAIGSVLVASFTVDQAALAARPRARERRAGRLGAAAPRLRLPPRRRARHRAVHRPRRRLGHRLLRHRRGHAGAPTWPPPPWATRSTCRAWSPPARRPARRRPAPWSPAGTGDNMAAALGMALETGDVLAVLRHLGRRLRDQRARRSPTAPARSPASPTPPAASCRWSPP